MKRAGVFVDGKFVGFSEHGGKLVRDLREMRRNGDVASQINVAFYARTNEVFINTDEGRVRRPLIVVKNGKPLLTAEHVGKVSKGELRWKNLVEDGLIEFLDADGRLTALATHIIGNIRRWALNCFRHHLSRIPALRDFFQNVRGYWSHSQIAPYTIPKSVRGSGRRVA